MNMMHIVSVGGTVGPADVLWENAVSHGIHSKWLLNNDVDLDT
jgi:hypothetical protein